MSDEIIYSDWFETNQTMLYPLYGDRWNRHFGSEPFGHVKCRECGQLATYRRYHKNRVPDYYDFKCGNGHVWTWMNPIYD